MSNAKLQLPPEWTDQNAVLLTWPHENTDWKPILDEVETLYFQLAKEILKRESLIISCGDSEKVDVIKSVLSKHAFHSLHVSYIPSNDTWARDHGPITVYHEETARLLDFNFNAWGGKFSFEKDNLINTHLAKIDALQQYQDSKVNMVLEGGAIESNGEGVLLTTSECLLSPTRNPELSKSQIEHKLKELLGVKQVLWLDHGYLSGDDTDSHIDTLARFCAHDLICYVKCNDKNDEHFEALSNMEAQLMSFRQPGGEPYRLVPLPMVEPIIEKGERLPATYANFLIINGAVLFPVYGVKQDEEAIKAIQHCFPDREIIPINCKTLIKQHGSLHCITMQIPSPTLNTTKNLAQQKPAMEIPNG